MALGKDGTWSLLYILDYKRVGSMTKFPWWFLARSYVLGSSSFLTTHDLVEICSNALKTINMRKHGQMVVYKKDICLLKSQRFVFQVLFSGWFCRWPYNMVK